jgi:hypothetical protein
VRQLDGWRRTLMPFTGGERHERRLMMSLVRRIMVLGAGGMALGVLVPMSASAATAGWMVNGAKLAGSAALATTARVDEEGVFRGEGTNITCEGKTLNSIAPEIKAPNTGAASALEYTGCRAEMPCELSSPTIKSSPVTEEATLEGVLAVVATFKPTTGTLFTTIKLEGSECGLAGEASITGQFKVLAPLGQDEGTLGQINSITTEASRELKTGNNPLSVDGSALLQLAHGELWSFL